MPMVARSASWPVTCAMLGVCILFGSAPLVAGWYLGFIAMSFGLLAQILGLFLFISLVGAFGRPRGLKAVVFVAVLGALVATYAISGRHNRFKARMYLRNAEKYENMGKMDKANESYRKAYELDPTLKSERAYTP
jgi:hypothetical protein